MIKLAKTKVRDAIDVTTMDNPPVGISDIGEDGFNINIDSMTVDVWYIFRDYGNKKYAIKLHDDKTLSIVDMKKNSDLE